MLSPFWNALRLTALPLVCLLAALPASAAPDPSIPAPTQAAQYSPHELILKHTTPYQILSQLNWEADGSNADGTIVVISRPAVPRHEPILPMGVKRVYSVDSDNSLLVVATPDGFNLVKEIVKNLDIVQRRVSLVSLKVELVFASAADVTSTPVNFDLLPTSPPVQIVSGSDAALLYSLINKLHMRLIALPIADTANDNPVSLPWTSSIPFFNNRGGIIPNGSAVTATNENSFTVGNTLTMWPRINSDGTVMLGVEPLWENRLVGGNEEHVSKAPMILRSLASGDTLAVKIPLSNDDADSLLPPDTIEPKVAKPMTLLIFVTPTIVDDTSDTPKPPTAPVGTLLVTPAP